MSTIPDVIIIGGQAFVRSDVRPPALLPPDAAALTEREREIAFRVADGMINKEIGETLGISEHTVATHLRRAFAKLGVERRAALAARVHTWRVGNER